MNARTRIRRLTWLLPPLAALAMAGCGSDDDPAPTPASPPVAAAPAVTVESIDTGAYVAVLGDEANPVVAKYYAAADGSRLVVVADGEDRASTIYRRAAGGAWTAIPAPSGDVSITFRHHDATVPAAIDLATLAGRYRARLADGSQASFTLDAAGKLAAGATACRVSGTVASGGLPSAATVTLTASGCSGLPPTANGALVVDADYRPAAFRLVADDGASIAELWAFPD